MPATSSYIDPYAPTSCPEGTHDAVKRDPIRWRYETRRDAIWTNTNGRQIETRTHLACGSTLAKPLRKRRAGRRR